MLLTLPTSHAMTLNPRPQHPTRSQPLASGADAPGIDAAVEALAQALVSERQLIDELTGVMQRQRGAVGADDLPAVDDSVFATHRLLLTLGEARKRRRALNRLAGCSEDTGVRQLDDALGARMTPRLRAERAALQEAARRLSGEIEVNRRILRQAIAGNEAFVRAVRGGPEPAAGYGAPGAAAYAPAQPAVISRTV